MTSVLYKNNRLVADKRSTSSKTGEYKDNVTKIFNIKGLGLTYKDKDVLAVGLCGVPPSGHMDVVQGRKWAGDLMWHLNATDLREYITPDFTALMVMKDEVAVVKSEDDRVEELLTMPRESRRLIGIGSGWSVIRRFGFIRRALIGMFPMELVISIVSVRDRFTCAESDSLDIP